MGKHFQRRRARSTTSHPAGAPTVSTDSTATGASLAPGVSLAPDESSAPDESAPPDELAAPDETAAPLAPPTDWARVEGPTPTTGQLALTVGAREFAAALPSWRPMTAPPIPPLHHRVSAEAPGGIARDVARGATIVPRGEAAASAATAGEGLAVDGQDPAGTGATAAAFDAAPLTHRRIRSAAPAPHRELLATDLSPTYTSFAPGRRPAAPPAESTPTAMTWDPERGFRRPDGAGLAGLRPLRHRDRSGTARRDAAGTGAHDGDGGPDALDAPDAAETDSRASGQPGEPGLRYVPVAGPRLERPPSDVVDLIREATGVDVGNARIDRSPAVTTRAAELGAVAFTENATVHLPAELGDDRRARAVLAHELTHVAQQRRGGGMLAPEDSPEGQALEGEAIAVQRAALEGGLVRPLFLRSGRSVSAAPRGVQRLRDDADPYAWQTRDTPPSRQGARGLFGFGFLQRDPNSADGRALAARDEQWAQRWEATHADALQHRRNRRYAELVDDAQRELDIQNRREERSGDDELRLQRRDILDLRRRLDDEMPFQFGPPRSIDPYPDDPPLPPEEESPAPRPVSRAPGGAPTIPGGDGPSRPVVAPGRTLDAPAVGRASARRRLSLAHRRPGAGGGDQDDVDTSWQGRPATRRETIQSVFGGTLGGLVAGAVSDGDDEAQRRAAERDPSIMRRRHQRERELRHVALRDLATAARREERDGPVQLDQDAIADIRARVDSEMPLEFELPEYLSVDVDVSMDETGAIGDRREEPESADAETAGNPQGAGSPDVGGATGDDPHAAADGAPDEGAVGATTSPGGTAGRAAPALAAAVGMIDRAGSDAAVHDPAVHDPALHDAAGRDDETLARHVFAAASDLDLEQLARRLYGRFRRDLRRELLIDRERAGTLADAC